MCRWGRIQTYEEPESEDFCVDVGKPWSAFFAAETKVTVIKTGAKLGGTRRRSRSIEQIRQPIKRDCSPAHRFDNFRSCRGFIAPLCVI